MSLTLKPYLLGLALGLAPIASCSLLYYGAPYLVDGNAGALLSFAVMGLFMISFVAVFVVAVILMNRNFRIIGGVAIIAEIIQFIVALIFLA